MSGACAHRRSTRAFHVPARARGAALRSARSTTRSGRNATSSLSTIGRSAIYASQAPYDVVEILVNGRTYGGGGIFNLYATVAADSAWAPYVFVHEFGHHFAALADEYFTSDVAYNPPATRVEPWEPNVTALLDPAVLKWKDLVTPGTPLPTPWNKGTFETMQKDIQARRRAIRAANRPEDEMDALFREEMAEETKLFAADPQHTAVGAFEGANYEPRGYYRPADRLHHVHAKSGAVLRRVPARADPHHRSVQPAMTVSPPVRAWLPWLVLLSGLFVTSAGSVFVAESGRARDQIRFESAGQEIISRLRGRVETAVALLRAGSAVMAAKNGVTRDQFIHFVRHLELRRRFVGVEGIGYAGRVAAADIPGLEARMCAEGVKDFRVWPAGAGA